MFTEYYFVVYSPKTDRIGFFWRVIILQKFIINVSSLSQYKQCIYAPQQHWLR